MSYRLGNNYAQNKYDLIYKKKVKEIDLDLVRPQRGGVILYTKINGELIFGLGVDTRTGEYTDFAGGISYKQDGDKNVVNGSTREFYEETLGIFGHITAEDVAENLAIYNYNIFILFKNITYSDDINIEFKKQYDFCVERNMTPEVSDIVWLTLSEFKNAITKRGILFHRVQNFLQKAGNFYWLLD